MVIALLGTRPVISVLRKRKLGQQVRSDGPQAHLSKSGTPTMGGIVIIIASLIGYVARARADRRSGDRLRRCSCCS